MNWKRSHGIKNLAEGGTTGSIVKTTLVPSFCVESHQYIYHSICLDEYFYLICNLSIFADASNL